MSVGSGKCSKIRHIVRLRQMLRRWRNKARMSATRIPTDVPSGHVAVSVGNSCRRFVVRATYLNHPVFKKLLVQAEEEYGFTNQGPLAIPCDETVFEEAIRFISLSESGRSARFVNFEDFRKYCHVGFKKNIDFWTESRPLLHEIANNNIWEEIKIMTEPTKKKIILARDLTQFELARSARLDGNTNAERNCDSV